MKELSKWISGLWGGIFIGALAVCPAKEISLPVSAILSAAFGYFGWKK